MRLPVNRVVLGSLALLVVLAIGGAVWVAASRHPADSLDPAITSSLASAGTTVSCPGELLPVATVPDPELMNVELVALGVEHVDEVPTALFDRSGLTSS